MKDLPLPPTSSLRSSAAPGGGAAPDEASLSTVAARRLKAAEGAVATMAAAAGAVASELDAAFAEAVAWILDCEGRVVLCGIGKAGLIGAKISATMASTGTPSDFLHPAEARHGDLGRVASKDLVLLLSSSGESEEVTALIEPLRRLGARLVALTGAPQSTLAKGADLVLCTGKPPEACPLGLAPTASTAALLVLGDALAMVVLGERDFDAEHYSRFHPGGSLGRKLMKVSELMRTGPRVTEVSEGTSAKATLLAMNATEGRPGAALVVSPERRLVGIFTDGDLARALQAGSGFLDEPVDAVMARDPTTIAATHLAADAFRLLRERRIDQLPVVDAQGCPLGLLDVQDMLDARILS